MPFRSAVRALASLLLSVVLLVAVRPTPAVAQVEDTTPTKTVSIVPPDQRPDLSVTSTFQDPSNNGRLDAAEAGTLSVTVTNQGQGPAEGVEVWIDARTAGDQVTLAPSASSRDTGSVRVAKLDRLPSSLAQTFSVPVVAANQLSGRPVKLAVTVEEGNGFGLGAPHFLTINTETYRPPSLTLAGYDVSSSSSQSIQPGSTSTVTLRVQNSGLGTGRALRASVEVGRGGVLAANARSEFTLGSLEPQATSFLELSVVPKANAESVPLDVHFSSAEDPYEATKRVTIPVSASDRPPVVDRKIPETGMDREHAVAVVVGIRNYQSPQIPNVDYAVRDAQTMKKYLVQTLGFRPGNVIELMNPTKAELDAVFGTAQTHRGRLSDYLRSDTTEVFVYYSGHGAPNPEENGRTYFVPSNGSTQQLGITGYPVNQLYENLAKLTSGPVTVAIDACFSGQSESGTLIRNASPALLSVENPMVGMENGMVLTASKATQISSWYPEKQHGLFTYFLLKGLRGEADRNEDGAVTGSEMKTYLSENVTYYARRLHSRTQSPQVMGKGTDRVLVRYSSKNETDASAETGR